MSVVGKMESVVEVKAPAAKFHEVLSQLQATHRDQYEPRIHVDGSPQVAKEKMEIIANENLITKFKVIEGRILEKYKSFYSTMKVTEKDDRSLVHVVLEYAKLNEDAPDPSAKLKMIINIIKDIDAYLLAQQP